MIAPQASDALCAMLLHSVWQLFTIAALVALANACLTSSKSRYAAQLVALLAMFALPAITFFLAWPAAGEQFVDNQPALATQIAGIERAASPASPNIAPAHFHPQTPGADLFPGRYASPTTATERPLAASPLQPRLPVPKKTGWLASLRPLLVAAWLAGVSFLSLRLLMGLFGVAWLRGGAMPLPSAWNDEVAAICRRLQMRRVAVLVSTRVCEAIATGFIRPLVLLPASWLCEVPPETLQAVIAHELSHIRRHDLWINLLQRMLELLMFYHPAVWWLSRRMRDEREMCCDEQAVSATGKRLEYAQALEFVARRRVPCVEVALAAGIGGDSMSLLRRVRNVLGVANREPGRWWPVGLMAMLAIVAIGVVTMGRPGRSAMADDPPKDAKKDTPKEGDKKEGDKDKPAVRREGEPRREGDRPREEGPRREDGPRREGEPRREGDRPALRREGEPGREGPRREGPGREGPGREGPGREEPRREGFEGRRPEGGPPELMRLIMELREEVSSLRREVRELRESRRGEGPMRDGPREGFRGDAPPRREGFEGRRPEGPGREGDRPMREGPMRDGPREGFRGDAAPRREGDRPIRRPEGARPEGARPEADRPAPRREGDKPEPRREGDKPAPKAEGDKPADAPK